MKFNTSSLILSLSILASAEGFAFLNKQQCRTPSTSLKMGLFDGVKDAFSAPALERSSIDAERETPIDRWMGWSTSKDDTEAPVEAGSKAPSNFVDSMDTANYVTAVIQKPMGIVFEENDEEYGGIFLLSLKEGGNADTSGLLKPGDQLVAVGDKAVKGIAFDEALGAIVESKEDTVELVFFRGSAEMFYGPTAASKEWLEEFLASQ